MVRPGRVASWAIRAYTSAAVVIMSCRTGHPGLSSSQVSRTPLGRFACFCRSDFAIGLLISAPPHRVLSLVKVVETPLHAECAAEAVFLVIVHCMLIREYHDREWDAGTRRSPVFRVPDAAAAQAGLNWSLVLNKRQR